MASDNNAGVDYVVRERESLQLGGDIMNGMNQAVMYNASVQEGHSVQLSVQVLDPVFVQANAEGIATAINAFIDRVRTIARSSGLPL